MNLIRLWRIETQKLIIGLSRLKYFASSHRVTQLSTDGQRVRDDQFEVYAVNFFTIRLKLQEIPIDKTSETSSMKFSVHFHPYVKLVSVTTDICKGETTHLTVQS